MGRGKVRRAAFFIATIWLCGAAQATTVQQVERTCPVGGAKFQSTEVGSTTSFGMRLDLRPLGMIEHIPYVECPNGFVFFDADHDFTPAEVATMTHLVASQAYQRLRKAGLPAARVVLLKNAIGVSDADMRGAYMQAAFEAEDRMAETARQRYLALAASAYAAFLAGHDAQDDDWWSAKLRLVEIARQRGRFAQALRLADALGRFTPPQDSIVPDALVQIRRKARARDAAPATLEQDAPDVP